MDKSKIIYNGLCCKVNTKAAFVDKCLKTPETSSDLLLRAMAQEACDDMFYQTDAKEDGLVTLSLELNEVRREGIYEIGRAHV